MKKITSFLMFIAFMFSPLSPVFGELSRDEQVELLRAEITRVTGQLNAILEERVYAGYALILQNRGGSLTPLRIGDRGTQVVQLQTLLAKEGVYNGPSTGYYGPLTDAAVREFEKKYEFYIKGHTLSSQDKIVDGSFYNFSFNQGGQQELVPVVISREAEEDIEFTRDVIAATYSDVDKYKQDVFLTLNATDGSAFAELALGIESVADTENEEVYIYIDGDVKYDLGFLASGEGEIEAEMILTREGMFMRVQETDLFPVPTEFEEYFGEWVGMEFDDLDALLSTKESQDFNEALEDAFEQMFNSESQVDAYDMFPFYAIDTSTKLKNTSLSGQGGEDVYTYDIRFDLKNFDQLAEALNNSDQELGSFKASDIAVIADQFSDTLGELDFKVNVTESLQIIGADLDFSHFERTDFGTTQVQFTLLSINRIGEGTVPNRPNTYKDLVELYEETVGEYQSKARDVQAVASLQQLQTAFVLNTTDEGYFPGIEDVVGIDGERFLGGSYELSDDAYRLNDRYCVSYELENTDRGSHYQIDQTGARYQVGGC